MKKKLIVLSLTLLLVITLIGITNFINAASTENAWFPVSELNLTQIAYESYSHGSSNHIDCIGGTYAFAPFTGKVVNVNRNFGVTLFQSIDKVKYADGSIDYMTVMFMHGSNYDTLKSYYDQGKVISQGSALYKVGGTGSGGALGVYGSHYDIGVYRGKTSTLTSSYSKFGNTYAYKAFHINKIKTPVTKNPGKLVSGNTVYNGAPSNWSNLWVYINDNGNGGSTGNTNSGKINIIYQTYDDVKKTWLPNVTDTQDYAGIFGHDVDCVYAKLSSGNVTYKVHYKGGSWLPAVTNRSDYAGIMNKPIDGLMMKTDTGRAIHYQVHLRPSNKWLPYVTGYNENDSNNGYAGVFGKEIDGIRAYLD